MRKTKIICTLGPSTESELMLRELMLAGANVFRLNMSHATHEWVREVVPRIRRISRELDYPLAVLLDTQGPAIRTGDLPAKLDLKAGDLFEFTVGGATSEALYSVDVNYDGLIHDVSVGDTMLVDNGVIHMEVLEKMKNRIRCRVLTSGVLGSRRHINLPGVKVNLPPLTEKDRADIAVGVEVGVDLVALSFCREPDDVQVLRQVLTELGSDARIVAKIEDQLAVRNLDGIIANADWIMVARGDLGIECALEDLPIIQRLIVKRCLTVGRPVIVATHMLESMIANPVPTRAEVTDIANAVYEQADAIMLSGETTVGQYPVECVKVLDRVARRIERSGGANFAQRAVFANDRQRTVHSAVVLANSIPRSRLLVFTRRCIMADCASGQRPTHAPIFGVAPNEATCRKIAINWGVSPILMPFHENPTENIHDAQQILRERGLVEPGDTLIVVSYMQVGEERFDSIQVRPVE
jgi:pyruvate kinase